ncbi:MAG TPA: hypothetical protein ENN80_07675, partial [Candidatus Hydrogenedentes bacterium]|nr:hypothetical protein [Candidatus Hydrogenedentota bacterium]
MRFDMFALEECRIPPLDMPNAERTTMKGECVMVRACVVLFAGLLVCRGAAGAELSVLNGTAGDAPASEMLDRYFQALSEAAFERRRAVYEEVKTPEDCAAYQERLHAFYVEQLGGWPERTPLNAQVVGAEAKDGYRLEKVIYESRPDFFVTALLHLPDADPPYPGVLVPCGHSSNGKASEAYQRACILLARHGMAALCYDPIGQGERHQVLDHTGKVLVSSSTIEHTLVGVGAILTGTNTAAIRIWDGIRGIDYLVERDEIDPERIGCTGNSGGGTLTSYIMALDRRVKVAAPSCYLTSFEKLLETIGPQDAEQNIHAQVAFGMNHADYVLMRAPKPTLMCCATRDFFDISGSWDTFRQAKRFYTRLGFSERMDLAEVDEQHGFSEGLRVAMTRWMRRWLVGLDEPIIEPDLPVLTDPEALCTPTGQVLQLAGARSAWDLLAEREEELAAARKTLWRDTPRDEMLRRVREVAGIRPHAELNQTTVRILPERMPCEGYAIAKVILRPEPGVYLPALVFVPEEPSGDACLYLHGDAKEADAASGGPIEQRIKQGQVVMAPDLRGIGETESPGRHKSWEPYFGPDWQTFFRGYLLGKSFVGMRTEDAVVCALFLRTYEVDEKPHRIHLLATGETA